MTAPAEAATATAVPTTSPPPPPTSVPPPAGPDSVGQPIGPAHSAAFGPCPSSPSVGFGSWNSVDFNGDGSIDTWRLYQDTASQAWRVALEDGTGVSYDDEALAVVGPPPYTPQGGIDANSDGRDDAFITVGAGAYSTLLGLYTLVGDCDLTRATLNGQPFVFDYGQSAMQVAGVKCADATNDGVNDVIQYQGTLSGSVWNITPTAYSLSALGQLASTSLPPLPPTTNPGPYAILDCPAA